MTWDQRIQKLTNQWQDTLNNYEGRSMPLSYYELMNSKRDFRGILNGIKTGDLKQVSRCTQEGKMIYPFIAEMLYIRDKCPTGVVLDRYANENSYCSLYIGTYEGKFVCPNLTWFGKKDRASILLALSRLIRDGEKRCLKHPLHRKV